MFWAEKIDQNEFFYSKELLLNFSFVVFFLKKQRLYGRTLRAHISFNISILYFSKILEFEFFYVKKKRKETKSISKIKKKREYIFFFKLNMIVLKT